MSYRSLRELLERLTSEGKVKRVAAPVDKDGELACITRWVTESFRDEEAFAVQFDNIRGHDWPVLVGLHGSRHLYGRSLNLAADEILSRWRLAMRKPVPPARVDRGPVMERVLTGKEVDLERFPIPTWTPGRDAAPYIASAGVITRDPETGVQNLGIYRLQLQDRSTLGIFFGTDHQHGAIHYRKYRERDQAMPVAVVLGAPPCVNLAAAAKTAYGVDEMAVAGGLGGFSVDLVAAPTTDLLVPAQAEILIEGTVPPARQLEEGPFGESLGYMQGAAPAPVVEVSAICSRQDPIFQGYVQQLPPSEGHLIQEFGCLGPLLYYLVEKMGLKGVRDLALMPGSAGTTMLVVQVTPGYVNSRRPLGKILSGINFGQKFVVMVDEDIDVRDPATLQWALSTRVDPAGDIQTYPTARTYQSDPAILASLRGSGGKHRPPYDSSMVSIDATLKCDGPEISLPGRAAMLRALDRWEELGLPGPSPRGRLARLLCHHTEEGIEFGLRQGPPEDPEP